MAQGATGKTGHYHKGGGNVAYLKFAVCISVDVLLDALLTSCSLQRRRRRGLVCPAPRYPRCPRHIWYTTDHQLGQLRLLPRPIPLALHEQP
jgi:hypothetical protein